MRISEARAVDVRGPLTAQRGRLLDLLASLGDAQWAAPMAAPQWPVKDVALHLLNVDLGWLARERDRRPGRDHSRASWARGVRLRARPA